MLEDELKKPFPVEKLSWRVGNKNKDKTKANMLVYIDSRDVQDRLDEVCGINGWSDSYENVGGRLVCTIAIHVEDGWTSKSDGAGDTDIEGEKGGLSDAFKRAAVKWGIGRYLYNAKDFNTWVSCKDMSDFDIYKNNKAQLDDIAMKISKTTKPSFPAKVEAFHDYIKTVGLDVLESEKFTQRYSALLSSCSYDVGCELAQALQARIDGLKNAGN
ncbi:MAG: Rad52/Rad22 family DNA repair protein [Clostridium sp.]|nr:Rad52/Rad22 family DNA repair protein [Clostridium sp.]